MEHTGVVGVVIGTAETRGMLVVVGTTVGVVSTSVFFGGGTGGGGGIASEVVTGGRGLIGVFVRGGGRRMDEITGCLCQYEDWRKKGCV